MSTARRPPRRRGGSRKPGRFRLVATEPAKRTIDNLSGAAEARYERHANELRSRGCRAAGYRLLGGDGNYSEYCCLHLYRTWRLITTFDSKRVIIVAVGQHDDQGFYRSLSANLDISPVGRRREQKPDCCGEDGWPTLGTFRS